MPVRRRLRHAETELQEEGKTLRALMLAVYWSLGYSKLDFHLGLQCLDF